MKILERVPEIVFCLLVFTAILAWALAALLGPLAIIKFCVLYLLP